VVAKQDASYTRDDFLRDLATASRRIREPPQRVQQRPRR
jgi:hypothetical protein